MSENSTPQTAHADICIPFEVNGEQFEAVGFLMVCETNCLGREACRRADNGHLIGSEEDWQFLYRNRSQLPVELRRYLLFIPNPPPGSPRYVSYLHFEDYDWRSCSYFLDFPMGENSLVVRRRVGSPA